MDMLSFMGQKNNRIQHREGERERGGGGEINFPILDRAHRHPRIQVHGHDHDRHGGHGCDHHDDGGGDHCLLLHQTSFECALV